MPPTSRRLLAGACAALLWAAAAGPASRAQGPPAPPASPAGPALRLHGLVEASDSFAVVTPRITGAQGISRLTIVRLAPKGTLVKRGDLIVEFDRQQQLRTALDKQAEWRDLDEQIRKKIADQRSVEAQDETSLTNARNAVEVARLDMLKNPILPRIAAEKNALELEGAQAKLSQLEITVALKRKAAKADLQILEVRRARAERAMRHAERNAEKMIVRAPIDGLVVLKSIWKGDSMGEPQDGEELWPGSAVLDIVGPSAMRVRVKVNQADLGRLRIGQTARVTLDAYPGRSYPARLAQMSPVGVTGQFSPKVRTFTALFAITGSDPQLAPDLSAAVDVDLGPGVADGTR
jgi:HlyD family secretion protein